MGNRRFTPITAVLILVLIGALYMVGKTVNPPPPAPPAPPPPVQKQPPVHANNMPSPDEIKRRKMDEQKHNQEMAAHQAVMGKAGNKPAKNPSETATSSEYFLVHSMGPTGLKQNDGEDAKEKILREKAEAAMRQAGPTPMPSGAVPK